MREILGNKVLVENKNKKEEVIIVRKSRDLLGVLEILKKNTLLQFKKLVDITGIDRGEGSVEVVYMLVSVRYSRRIRVVVKYEGELESVRGLYEGGNWLEREVFDMMGIVFKNHGDLRRLLTDYGFKGNPLLKGFKGNEEVVYNEERKGIVR